MGRWADTRWSVISALVDSEAAESYTAAWTHLVEQYRPAFVAVVRETLRARGAGASLAGEAEEVVDGFLARSLEKGWFARPDPSKGTFRAFCCTALRRFAKDWLVARRARKRQPPGGAPASLDGAPGPQAPGEVSDLDGRIDAAWTDQLIDQALTATGARSPVAGTLLRRVRSEPDPDRRALAAELGVKPSVVAVRLSRARAIFAEELWSLVKDTCGAEAAFHAECASLRPHLARYLDRETHASLYAALPDVRRGPRER